MRQYTFYTNATAAVTCADLPTARKFVYKAPGTAPVEVAVADGAAVFPTGAKPCKCACQFVDGAGAVLAEGELTIRQDLAHADADFDPRSPAVITLEAIEAKIAGRALTLQQSKVTIGDRSIEYMNSIDELLKWREYYAALVAKEQGHAAPTAQVCRLRRV